MEGGVRNGGGWRVVLVPPLVLVHCPSPQRPRSESARQAEEQSTQKDIKDAM